MSSVLVGVDASLESAIAAREAWKLAQKTGRSIHLRHVMAEIWWDPRDVRPPVDRDVNKELIATRKKRVLTTLGKVLPEGFEDHFEIDFGNPAWVMQKLAGTLDADLIAMGGNAHSGLDRVLHRSIPHEMLRVSPVPVLIINGTLEFRRILAAIDFSDMGIPTAQAARALATELEAECHYLTVVDRIDGDDDAPPHPLETAAADACPELFAGIDADPNSETITRIGDVVDTISEQTKLWPADLLVVGAHGKNFLTRALLGSVAEALAWQLPTSTLIVPPKA